EGAVEPAAVRHRVEVPADEERTLRGAGQREPLVPGLVDQLLGARAGNLAAQPLPRPLPGVRPGHPLGAVAVARQPAQLPELGHGALRAQRHGATLTPVLKGERMASIAAERPAGRAVGVTAGVRRVLVFLVVLA